jgi:hypothetical protein
MSGFGDITFTPYYSILLTEQFVKNVDLVMLLQGLK